MRNVKRVNDHNTYLGCISVGIVEAGIVALVKPLPEYHLLKGQIWQ